MRGLFLLIHRWAGLFIAVFLFIAGMTGAVISWDRELDAWLNPHLFAARSGDAGAHPLPALELAQKVEAADPRAKVTYLPLLLKPGQTAQLSVGPRTDPATGKPFALDYNQVFVEPSRGEVVGKRLWGRASLNAEDLMPFLYRLHYSLHIPGFMGVEGWGLWLMGIVAIVWLFDCFVGFYLTLPASAASRNRTIGPAPKPWWAQWRRSWRIKAPSSFYRLNFDVHRAFGLWLWVVLAIVSFTSVSMNLGDEVVRPIVSKVSTLTPGPFEQRQVSPTAIVPEVSFAAAIDTGRQEAARRGWAEDVGSVFYGQHHGIYAVMFFLPGADHGSGGMGVKRLYVDARHGAVIGSQAPWEGTAGDVFMQLQFPLHSGRIAGLAGRILLSVTGVVVAILSLTGIVIWFKKRQARLVTGKRRQRRSVA